MQGENIKSFVKEEIISAERLIFRNKYEKRLSVIVSAEQKKSTMRKKSLLRWDTQMLNLNRLPKWRCFCTNNQRIQTSGKFFPWYEI